MPDLVQVLVDEGVLMDVDGEYRLQTTEGAAWESEFRRRRSALLHNETQLAAQRTQLLAKQINAELSGVLVLHGAAKVKRKVMVHLGLEPPPVSDDLLVWVRDGFQESESAVVGDIQKRSIEDVTLHVLIPKTQADSLKNALAAALAAEETLNFKGQPVLDEGREARKAIVMRKTAEDDRVASLMAEIVGAARLFLSGGQELGVITLRAGVEDAAKQVLDRLYPKFHPADSANWPTVWKKAKEGGGNALNALNAVQYAGDPHKHPVTAAILAYIGAGKAGSEVEAHFTGGGAGYGWPKDAVDAGLAVLMVSEHLSARLQSKPVSLADLDQRNSGCSTRC